MSSMKPMALAAREPRGPAEMVFTLMPYFRPASKDRTLVSLSSAAFALLMPPPYPARIVMCQQRVFFLWILLRCTQVIRVQGHSQAKYLETLYEGLDSLLRLTIIVAHVDSQPHILLTSQDVRIF